MRPKHYANLDPAAAARRLERALAWRDAWRREMAGPSRQPSPAPKAGDDGFSTAIARAEFGRHYFDSRRFQQTIDKGAVIWTDRKPPRKTE